MDSRKGTQDKQHVEGKRRVLQIRQPNTVSIPAFVLTILRVRTDSEIKTTTTQQQKLIKQNSSSLRTQI